MEKAYSRIRWKNGSYSTETPLNETNMNRMDAALDVIDDRVCEHDSEIQTLQGYETRAAESAAEAYASEQNAAQSESNAQTSEENASDSATLSRSWAVGGTNTRQGEDTDNSKYYSEVSESNAETSEYFASQAEDTLDTIRTVIGETVFSVNFLTGELEYTSPGYTFSINMVTGELEWEANV